MRNKKDSNKKASTRRTIYKTLFVLCLTVGFVWSLSSVIMVEPEPELKVETWHTIYEGPLPVGENEPGKNVAGFMSLFCLDYGEDPETVLANNATDWENEATVYAYADADDFNEDLKADDAFYFVVRAKFTDTEAMDAGVWEWDDMRCGLEVSGDETFNFTGATAESDNSSGNGDAVVSNSDADEIWINFWFDDGADGYTMPEAGTITVVWVKLEALY